MEKARLFQGPFLLPQKRERKRIMSVQLSYKEGVLTARLSGEIDHHSAREMREAIDDTAQKVKPACLRLDFSQVPFMDSSGIGVIIGRTKKLKYFNDSSVSVCNMSDRVDKLLKCAGIYTIVHKL